MGATSSHYDTTLPVSAKTMTSPFSNPHPPRLISHYDADDRNNNNNSSRREEHQRILTLREYQLLRATRSQSHTASTSSTADADVRVQHPETVTRNASAPCLSSRSSSSSSSSNLSSAASSSGSGSRHLSPRQRTHRYTSACVHPQFQCGNCNSTCNIVPYTSTGASARSSSTVSNSSYDSASSDASFCNRDCYYSYCFRLAEELDCTADDIIESNYLSNGYIQDGSSGDNMVSDDHETATPYPSSYHQQQAHAPVRHLQISRVH